MAETSLILGDKRAYKKSPTILQRQKISFLPQRSYIQHNIYNITQRNVDNWFHTNGNSYLIDHKVKLTETTIVCLLSHCAQLHMEGLAWTNLWTTSAFMKKRFYRWCSQVWFSLLHSAQELILFLFFQSEKAETACQSRIVQPWWNYEMCLIHQQPWQTVHSEKREDWGMTWRGEGKLWLQVFFFFKGV